jgi:Tol biopolymer transport system component
MRLACAGAAASFPQERRGIVQEAVRRIGTRRAIIFLGVSMAVLFLASGLLPTEPSAQTTSPEGKIVFVRPGTEPSEHCFGEPCPDIWVMDADGTNQTNLTNTPDSNEGQPAWSSDGTRLGFTSDQDEVSPFRDIWVMDADGTDPTNLTPTDDPGTPTEETDNFDEYRPSWAPSGTQIAFVRALDGPIISEQPDIFVMDTDPTTDDATNLTNSDASEIDPAWSPDGTKIAFAGVRNSGSEIVTMDPTGQNEEILTGDSFEGDDRAPEWSPDSTKVVFMKQSQVGGCCEPWEIWAVNRDGSGDTNLTNHPSDDMGPAWSPDGTEITFTSNRDATVEDPFRTDIYAMAAPTTLPPPPSATASITTSQHSGVMGLAASDVLGRAASAQTTSDTAPRPLTTDGRSSDPDWADTLADTTPPKVMSTSPANDAKRIAPGVNVTATFTEAMDASATDGDPSTITGTTFKLVRLNADGTTTRVTAAVSYAAATKKAILNPASNLSLGRTYKATVTTGAQDLAGNALDQSPTTGTQPKNWKFTVRG